MGKLNQKKKNGDSSSDAIQFEMDRNSVTDVVGKLEQIENAIQQSR